MSTENNANGQNITKRRGPDPWFVWGIIAVVILCGILYAGYTKISSLKKELDNSVSKEEYNKLETRLEKEKADLETQLQNEKASKADLEKQVAELQKEKENAQSNIESLNKEKEELDNKLKEQESYPGARWVIPVNYDKDDPKKTISFAFRWCPAGTFMMGSPESEEGRDEGETLHEVTLTKGFWMLETEVTVGMFQAFVSDSGYEYESKGNMPNGWTGSAWEKNSKYSWRNPGFSQDDNHPVTCVSWDDAVEFCKWLSNKTGQRITLPTEAQWEYACRAGTKGSYAGALDSMAWYKDNAKNTTHPVGTKKSNAWGLYDMHGNVWEWCEDSCEEPVVNYPSGSVTDPMGYSSKPSNNSNYIYRGGNWFRSADYCRSAKRVGRASEYRDSGIGFRIVKGQ